MATRGEEKKNTEAHDASDKKGGIGVNSGAKTGTIYKRRAKLQEQKYLGEKEIKGDT